MIGTKAWSLSLICIPSGWGHPWVKCVLHSPLISIEGLLSLLVSVTSDWGPGSGAFACPLFSLVRLHRLPLCSSSLLCVASFCSVGFLLLASFLASPPFLLLAFLCYCRSLRPLSLSLPLVFHFAVLGSPPVTWWPCVLWPCSLVFSGTEVTFLLSRVSAPRVSSFLLVFQGFPFRAPLLSFLPLGYSYFVGAHCVPCSSPLSILWWLCLFCLQWSFFLIYRFPVIFLVLPFVSPWFRSFSSPTSSSSSVPCRRVLLVCLQLRLRCWLGILLPCPLLWLLPLRLPSGFRLLLTFSGAVLLLAGFRWGLVVPARRVFSSFYLFNLSSMMVPSLTAGSEYPSNGGGGGGGGVARSSSLRRLITS